MFWQTILLADGVSPLAMKTGLHLFFGNAILGIVEGLLLVWLFKTRPGRSICFMILANYVSAWVGYFFFEYARSLDLPIDLYNVGHWLWIMIAAAFFITLILEWPFIFLCVRKQSHWFRRSVLASIIIQSFTSLILLAWFGSSNEISIYKETSLRPYGEILSNQKVTLYYIASEDGDVYRIHLGEDKPEKIYNLNSQNIYDRLFAYRPQENNDWNLMAQIAVAITENAQPILIENKLPENFARFDSNRTHTHPINEHDDEIRDYYNHVADLRPENHRQLIYEVEILGVYYGHQNSNDWFYLSLETPFIQWEIRSLTILPDEKVIFQLGKDQICLFDPETRRLGLLSKGRGPVVGLGE
jgi:hypothetical protein